MITGKNTPESDLINMLAEKTEERPELSPQLKEAKIIKIYPEPEPAPQPNPADFEYIRPEPEPEPVPQTLTAEPAGRSFINDIEQPVKKPITLAQAEEQAELIIDFVDGADVLLLPSMYKKSIFGPGDLEKIKALKEKVQNEVKGETTYTSAELELWTKKDDYNELIKKIPYTDDERKTLKGPLVRIMQKKNWEISAEAALISAAALVMVPRLLPLFNKLERSL